MRGTSEYIIEALSVLLLVAFATSGCTKPSRPISLCKAPLISADGAAGVGKIKAACDIEINAFSPVLSPHVPEGTRITYASNPPSSGPHYPDWASYQDHYEIVPRSYYIHNLEHGGVVFLYKCDQSDGCPQVVAGLKRVMDGLPDDPVCADEDRGVRVRALLTRDPLLDVPIAAAAWGWTYKAQCLDAESLSQFAISHFSAGPECTCSDGTSYFVEEDAGADAQSALR